MNRWQRLAGIRAVCAGFEPTHAGDREVRLVLGKRAQLPRGWSRPAGRVAEGRDGLLERNFVAVLAEWITPVLPVVVTPCIDELLVLPVGNLEPIQEVIGQRHNVAQAGPRRFRPNRDHAGGYLASAV